MNLRTRGSETNLLLGIITEIEMKVRHVGLCGINDAVRGAACINQYLMLIVVRDDRLNYLDRNIVIIRHALNISRRPTEIADERLGDHAIPDQPCLIQAGPVWVLLDILLDERVWRPLGRRHDVPYRISSRITKRQWLLRRRGCGSSRDARRPSCGARG